MLILLLFSQRTTVLLQTSSYRQNTRFSHLSFFRATGLSMGLNEMFGKAESGCQPLYPGLIIFPKEKKTMLQPCFLTGWLLFVLWQGFSFPSDLTEYLFFLS